MTTCMLKNEQATYKYWPRGRKYHIHKPASHITIILKIRINELKYTSLIEKRKKCMGQNKKVLHYCTYHKNLGLNTI